MLSLIFSGSSEQFDPMMPLRPSRGCMHFPDWLLAGTRQEFVHEGKSTKSVYKTIKHTSCELLSECLIRNNRLRDRILQQDAVRCPFSMQITQYCSKTATSYLPGKQTQISPSQFPRLGREVGALLLDLLAPAIDTTPTMWASDWPATTTHHTVQWHTGVVES
jgi:hypothetical protein